MESGPAISSVYQYVVDRMDSDDPKRARLLADQTYLLSSVSRMNKSIPTKTAEKPESLDSGLLVSLDSVEFQVEDEQIVEEEAKPAFVLVRPPYVNQAPSPKRDSFIESGTMLHPKYITLVEDDESGNSVSIHDENTEKHQLSRVQEQAQASALRRRKNAKSGAKRPSGKARLKQGFHDAKTELGAKRPSGKPNSKQGFHDAKTALNDVAAVEKRSPKARFHEIKTEIVDRDLSPLENRSGIHEEHTAISRLKKKRRGAHGKRKNSFGGAMSTQIVRRSGTGNA